MTTPPNIADTPPEDLSDEGLEREMRRCHAASVSRPPALSSRERAHERLDGLIEQARGQREAALAHARHVLTGVGEPQLGHLPAGLDLLDKADVAAIRGVLDAPARPGQHEGIGFEREDERRAALEAVEEERRQAGERHRALLAERARRAAAARALADAQCVAKRLGRPVPTSWETVR